MIYPPLPLPGYHGVLSAVFAALAAAGALAFIVAASGSEPLRAWQAYLVNFLFWTGMGFGAVLFVAVLNVTGAKWGRPLKRLAEGFAAYLPVTFILFWVLYLGRSRGLLLGASSESRKGGLAQHALLFHPGRRSPPAHDAARPGPCFLFGERRPALE